ncbi:MAG: hypothetical protein ACJA10_000728, partial [Oleispira sp.]
MKSKPAALNIAIIGGGLVGRLLAWRLASNIERFDTGVMADTHPFYHYISRDSLPVSNGNEIKNTETDNG